MQQVDIRVTLAPGAELPSYETEGASGMDVRCTEPFELLPLERKLVPTGISMELPAGYEAQVRARSGLALRHGIGAVNAPGTIDWDYRGEIHVLLINFGADTVRFERGERIAQLVIAPVVRANLVLAEALNDTERGEGGFGSTGSG